MSEDKHHLRVGDYLDHIVTAIEKINRYTKNMDRQGFLDDEKTLDAVAKNLENIGEASRRIQTADAELTKQVGGAWLPPVAQNAGRVRRTSETEVLDSRRMR